MIPQWLKCLFGFHPSDQTTYHSVGIADDYSHRHCESCGRDFDHRDNT